MAATEQATGRDAKQSLDGFLSGQPVYGGVPDYQAVISSIQKAYTTSVAAAVMESTASLLTIGKIIYGWAQTAAGNPSPTQKHAYDLAISILGHFEADITHNRGDYKLADFVVTRLLPLNPNDARLVGFAVRAYVRENRLEDASKLVKTHAQVFDSYIQHLVDAAQQARDGARIRL